MKQYENSDLKDDVQDCCMSGEPLMVLRSTDHHDAMLTVVSLCVEWAWKLALYNPHAGLVGDVAGVLNYVNHGSSAAKKDGDGLPGVTSEKPQTTANNPLAALTAFLQAPEEKSKVAGQEPPHSILVMQNVGRALHESPALATLIQVSTAWLKQLGRSVVLLVHPDDKLPPALEPYYHVIRHGEVNKDGAMAIIPGVIPEGYEPPPAASMSAIADAAAGLTRQQIESIAARLVVRSEDGQITAADMWEEKVKLFNVRGLVTVYKSTAGLAKMGGMKFFREDVVKLIQKGRMVKVLSAGAPGVGKSAGAFALGYDCGLNVLEANLGNIFAKYVGESEERVREMLELIEKNSPCIVVMDELPRFISTDGAGGQDGGHVNAKVGAELLKWLASKKAENVTIVATANEWAGVGTLVRAERFDFNVFTSIDMGPKKRAAIWDIYKAQYAITDETIPDDRHWTGAEIKACCRLASSEWFGESLAEAAERVTHVWDTQKEAVQEMERAGRAFCLNVETGKKFTTKEEATEPTETPRRVVRKAMPKKPTQN